MQTDLELVNGTLNGDKSAFETLVLRYQVQVYRLAYRIISDPSDASDIVQDAMLKAYQNLGSLKDREKFSLWLFRITKNQCISWIRKYQKNLMAVEDELSSNRLRLSPAPDEILIQSELHERVMKAISELPEHNREAVEMFYLEGQSYAEIQNKLGITRGTLGRFLHDARAHLREQLQAFHQAAVITVSGTLKRMLRLIPKEIGVITDTTAPFAAKCLMVSAMFHLMLLAGISITGLHWGASNGASARSDYGSVVKTSLMKIGDAGLIYLPSHIHAEAEKSVVHEPLPSRSQPLGTRISQAVSTQANSPQIFELASSVDESRAKPSLYDARSDPTTTPLHASTRLKRGQHRPMSSTSVSADKLLSAVDAMTSDAAPADDPGSWSLKEPIPRSYGPFYRYHAPVLNVRRVLTRALTIPKYGQFSAWVVQAMTNRSLFATVLVSGCDLEVLKVFVASDMAPMVITRSPVGSKHIRAMAGYDDATQRLVLIDPITCAVTKFSYSEFSSQWDDRQNACVLVFPQRVVPPETVRSYLQKYLPQEKVESMSIRVPKRR